MNEVASRELILGGARSGKSGLAESLAQADGRPVTYVATAEAADAEMADRIAQHQARRPTAWDCVEAPRALAETIRAYAAADRLLLVDCLTLWLANLLAADADRLPRERGALLAAVADSPGRILVVSNEVGYGVVPDHPLGRRFRDEVGLLNQQMAGVADRVILTVAGIPQVLKGPVL